MYRSILSLLTLTVAVGLLCPISRGQQTAPPAAAPAPGASRWPVQVDTSAGQVTVFQPQLEDFVGDTLKARAAVSVQPQGAQPTFGCVWLQSRVATDRVARTVQILDVSITQTRFPGADDATQAALTDAVKQVFTGRNVTLSLDSLLAMLQTIHKQQAEAAQLDSTPPKIVFVDHPAVKVQYDGTPRLVQVDNSPLLRADNTPFFVVLDPGTKTYYLKGAGHWFAAPDPMGPFQEADGVPEEVAALADSSGYQDPQAPTNGTAAPDASQLGAVEVITASDPTELIWTNGPAEMSTIAGTDLLYVTNTDSDVFLDIDSQQLYVLLSGRWYTSPNHDGPWTYVAPEQLPPDFARIPPDSDKADVLADVPNTPQAADAVADTYVPQTASIDMHQYDQPPISYDGDPDFEPIEGTDMTYAVNTDGSVINCQGQYYCCYNAVWYQCGAPVGPWAICTSVPQEIYTIPPSCPCYPCRFCYVYGHTADVCYVGYLPGYAGCFAYDGVVVFGTGYHYKPWIGRHYFGRPFTFGFSSRYNWYTGHWGFDFAVSFGGGRGWIGTAPHPFVRSGGIWFGYGGFRPVFAHDVAHLTAADREIALGESHRDAYVRDIYDHRNDVHREGVIRGPAVEDHGPGPVRAEVRDDVFADQQGNVYRKTVDGWDQRQGDQWRASAPAERHEEPAPVHAQEPDHPEVHPEQRPQERQAPPEEHQAPADNYRDLNRDYQARQAGDDRARSAPEEQPRQEAPPQESRGGGGGEDRGGGGGGGGGGRGR
jgi:hypothetical protein